MGGGYMDGGFGMMRGNTVGRWSEDCSSRIATKLVAKWDLPTAENFILAKK